MGKRLFRIRSEEIAAQIDQLVGTEVDLVLSTNRTLHGRLLDATPSAVILRDNIGHRHTVTIGTIVEIIYDRAAAY